MEEENGTQDPAGLLAGKFKSVDALVQAYGELEAEFTRRSQRLKELESRGESDVMDGEKLYLAATKDEGVRARIVDDYLKSLRGIPLLSGAGAGVTAPAVAPKSIREAGVYALSYLKKQNNP